MAAVLRFESGRHYCISCPSNTASHVSGHYRALTEKEKSDHGERMTILKATVKRAFKVCQSCHNNSTCSRTNEVVPHWDMEHSSTPEKRPTSTFQTPDKLPVPSPVLFPSPSLAGPSTPQKSKSVHSSPTVESPAKRRKSTTASTSELFILERQLYAWFPSLCIKNGGGGGRTPEGGPVVGGGPGMRPGPTQP